MLTKDLLRVSRAGGGYQPRFVDESAEAVAARVLGVFQGHVGESAEAVAARVLGVFQGHVGESYGELQDALTALEGEEADFKLVRGFAKLVEREATVETSAPLPPERARKAAFSAAEAVGVVTADEREKAMAQAAESLGSDPESVATSLYADLPDEQVVTTVDAPWTPAELVTQYNLSLAQTALFDATVVRVRSGDPKALVSAVKRLRLMYEIEQTPDGREVVVTGPDSLFRNSRRYGTRFARLLRTVAKTDDWRLSATIDDRGTERQLVLSDDDPVRVPGTDPVTDVGFDSDVEADFAARFTSLDLDWNLVREPEPLATGTRVMIPDFAFDWAPAGRGDDASDFRVYFEVMGFWTPEYVEKKLSQLADLEDVEMLVAVDESLGVGEAIESLDHRAIPYSGGRIRVKDVRDALRRYEEDLVAASAAALPDELDPDADVVTLASLAARHGVSEEVVEGKSFPAHERVGRTLVRPTVLDEVATELAAGLSLAEAEAVLGEYDIDETSAVLSRLGYRVEWEGLSGGTLRTTD
ncbi:DUF790 family protein [Haloarchaeobius amylolyticus]|uniref:DUF790 family protein n=1 Tax=Haloarchaeobius amylolyticus TaxID=1198296 RepID=UPI00226EBD95|nr:DUF790 family protein [Haloarchaeobius amylolyticus]